MKTTIKARRINYLHYLCTLKVSEMLANFFKTQWKYPINQKDWTELVKKDLEDFGFPVDINFFKSKSNYTITKLVKVKSKEYAWRKFMEVKLKHSKMDNLWYSDLKMQPYLESNKFTTQEVKTIFKFRTRMANFGQNFKNGQQVVPCPLCNVHLDSQAMAFQCYKIKETVDLKGSYDDIFKDDIPKDLVKTLTKIMDFRTQYMEERNK